MTRNTVDQKVSIKFESYHVGIAAEAFAAGLLAHAGYEVLVQYGANQPLYDLVALKGQKTLKVSVKGTQEIGWALSGTFKNPSTSYAQAAEKWLQKHGIDLVLIFVQFHGVELGQMPRVYVARAHEVAAHLKSAHRGRGDTTLFENKLWMMGTAKGHTDKLPEDWRFTRERIDNV